MSGKLWLWDSVLGTQAISKSNKKKNQKGNEKKNILNKMECYRPALGNELCQGMEMRSLSQPEPEQVRRHVTLGWQEP